jgi:hypothetical protein
MLPRVPPVSVQVKVTPRLLPATWPKPTPLVVQPAVAIAASETTAALIDSEVIVTLLSALERCKLAVAPKPFKSSSAAEPARQPRP